MDTWRRLVETYAISPLHMFAAGAVLALLAYGVIVFLPRRAALAELALQRQQLASETRIQNAALTRLNGQTRLPEDVATQLAAARLALPDADIDASLLGQLTRQARASGMAVQAIKRRPDESGEQYIALAFSLDLRGSYAQLTHFLTAIERLRRVVDVVGLAISVHQSTAAPAVIDASCDLHAYRLVNQVAEASTGVRR